MAGYAETTGLRTFMYMTGAVFAENHPAADEFADRHGMLGEDARFAMGELALDADEAKIARAARQQLATYALTDSARQMVHAASQALDAARIISDRAEAASERGLRDDDIAEIRRAREFLSTGLAWADVNLCDLDRDVAAL